MATVTSLPGTHTGHRGLTYWMDRVLKELENLKKSPDKDAVHDLRVAIRRCRSVGAVLQEVDPDPAWHQMRGVPKKLFRKLGELRDAQIMNDWVKDHGAENDKLRLLLQQSFETQEPELLDETLHLAGKFDQKTWKRLENKLRRRSRLVPPDSLAAQCLAIERYDDARDLHAKALRSGSANSWHALRIGLKKLRYTVESLLPEQYAAWSEDFKRLQDLLGEVHDLDVLSGIIKEKAAGDLEPLQQEWQRTIDRERNARLADYREVAVGKTSVWHEWRKALPHGSRLQLAAMARLRATARASDAHPHRAAEVSRISMAVFDALRHAHAAPAFASHEMRRVLRAAARLSGISVKGGGNAPQKAARRFLLNLPVPPSWTQEEWELLAWTLRYHRGPEPKTKNGFGRLAKEQQANIRALAGAIRLARGLRKCGVVNCTELRAEKSADAFVLHVPGLADSAENAARLAAAKHLLEAYLGKPLILKPVAGSEKIVALPAQPEQRLHFSAAAS
jgi:CHAD domain-containing protein